VQKTTQQRALWSVFLIKRYSSDHVKNNEMDEACGTYGTQETCIEEFGRVGGGGLRKETIWKTQV
jgi:hypothetical protein